MLSVRDTYPNEKANERKKCKGQKDVREECWRPLLRLLENVGYFRLRANPSSDLQWSFRWQGFAFRSCWQVQI
jgi:hypothetical protein